MNKFLSVIVLFVTLFNSCSPDDMAANGGDVDSYRIANMHYNFGWVGTDVVTIEYKKGKIVKRNGGGGPYWPAVSFDEGVYETVTYNSNQAIIVKATTTAGYTFGPNEKRFFFNGNKIDQCIILVGSTGLPDTIKYAYSGESIISKTTYSKGLRSRSNFYYNAGGNLDSIVTRYAEVNPVTIKYEIDPDDLRRDKEIFENYDTYPNPTKKLVIFDETFNRSLSANNYRTYTKLKFNKLGEDNLLERRFWIFVYENGKINLAK